jgi:cell division protein FtsN
MAQRRTAVKRKRGASRSGSSGSSPFVWFVAGLVVGLGIAGFAMFKGMVPRMQNDAETQEVMAGPAQGSALIESSDKSSSGVKESRYDFFTVLPEMDVVVPEQELARTNSDVAPTAPAAQSAQYILQAGSFRNLSDADQMKARLALLGAQANIEVVTVNDVKWHRVRIGPIQGSREADELRRRLRDNDIDTLILKDNS